METVFEANNELEAQMILDLLRRSRVEGELAGQNLPGAMGELPAMGLVRVLVQPEDAVSARQVIRDWESTTRRSDPPRRSPTPSRGTTGFLMGASVATAIHVWVNWTPLETDGIDFDRDGELDEVWHWDGDLVAKVEADKNLDGKTDLIANYRRGILHESLSDENFDGHLETRTQYERSNAYRQTSPVNADIGVEYRAMFEDGVLRRVHLVDSTSGRVRKVQTYRNGFSLVEATLDADDDGLMDTRIRYGPFEEEIERATTAD